MLGLRRHSCVFFILLVTAPMAASSFNQRPSRPAVPLEPIAAILDACKAHNVVALDEGSHGNEQGHAFRISLIRDPRFAATVNDIVVEVGNALYQDVMDRFVYGGDVPYPILRRVWQNTTQPHAGPDLPIYEEFFRAVRAVNSSLPKDRQLRVLLGDPPIDWDSPTARQDRRKWMEMRDSYPADLIQREVLAKHRRALVVYGSGHLQRKQMLANYEMSHPLAQTIVSLLERTGEISVFTIKTETVTDLRSVQADVSSWPTPSLTLLRGTILGEADFTTYWPPVASRFKVADGKLVPIPREEWRTLRMEEQFDALLYLGPPSDITISRLSPALCADREYMEMRLGRIALEGPKIEGERLKQYCANVGPK